MKKGRKKGNNNNNNDNNNKKKKIYIRELIGRSQTHLCVKKGP